MPISDEKHLANFRLIEDDSLLGYRMPMMKVIAMLIRLTHAKSKSTPQDEKKLTKWLLVGSSSQHKGSTLLYQMLCRVNGKFTPKAAGPIRQALHRLLNALTCPPTLGDDIIACPTEQALFLSSLTPELFKTASYVKSFCCKLQFVFRVIYIHSARLLSSKQENYIPFLHKEEEEEELSTLDLLVNNEDLDQDLDDEEEEEDRNVTEDEEDELLEMAIKNSKRLYLAVRVAYLILFFSIRVSEAF